MAVDQKKSGIDAEIEHCYKKLADLEPGSEQYNSIVENIRKLKEMKNAPLNAILDVGKTFFTTIVPIVGLGYGITQIAEISKMDYIPKEPLPLIPWFFKFIPGKK